MQQNLSKSNHMKGRMSQKSLDTWNVLRYRFIGGGPMVRRRQFVHLLTERGGSIDIRFIIVSLIVSLMMRSLCGNGFHILTLSKGGKVRCLAGITLCPRTEPAVSSLRLFAYDAPGGLDHEVG